MVGLRKTMGGKFGGSLGVGGNRALTENCEGVGEDAPMLPWSDRGPSVWGRFTKPAALILGPMSERASMAPSECFVSCDRVSCARCRPPLLEDELDGVGGVAGEEGTEEPGVSG